MRRLIVLVAAGATACGLALQGTESAPTAEAGASDASVVDATLTTDALPDTDPDGGVIDAGTLDAQSCLADANGNGQGGLLFAFPATTPPTIDGTLDDWACVPFFHLTSANGYVEKATLITGDIAFQWTPTMIYFAVHVQNGVPPSGNDKVNPYANDSVEFYLAQDDAPVGSYRPGDHHFVVDHNGLFGDYDPDEVTPDAGVFKSAVMVSGNDYFVEMAVASSAVGHNFTATREAFDVELNKTDGGNQVGILIFYEPPDASTVGSSCGSVPEPSCNTHLFAQLQLLQ